MKRFREILKTPNTIAALLIVLIGIVFYMLLNNLSAVWDVIAAIFNVLWPFILGLILAYLVNPIAVFFSDFVFKKVKRRRLVHVISVVIAYVVVLAVIGLIVSAIVPQLISSVELLLGNMEGYFNDARSFLLDLQQKYSFLDFDIDKLIGSWSDIFEKVSTWVVNDLLGGILDASYRVGTSVVNFLLSLVISVYILLDKDKLIKTYNKWSYSLISESVYNEHRDFLRRCNVVFKNYIGGNVADTIIIGVATFIFMLIMKMPYALLISTIAGITNLIPTFGPIIGAVPCLFILILVNPWHALWYLIFVIVIQMLDGNVIKPLLFSDSTGLSPLGVLLAIIIGGRLLGIVGMLLGIPVFALVSEIATHQIEKRLKAKGCDLDEEDTVKKKEAKKPFTKK